MDLECTVPCPLVGLDHYLMWWRDAIHVWEVIEACKRVCKWVLKNLVQDANSVLIHMKNSFLQDKRIQEAGQAPVS